VVFDRFLLFLQVIKEETISKLRGTLIKRRSNKEYNLKAIISENLRYIAI